METWRDDVRILVREQAFDKKRIATREFVSVVMF